MCLSTITRRKNLPREVTVHKVMTKNSGGWYRSYIFHGPPMKRGQWYPCNTEEEILTGKSQTPYLPGWHAWKILPEHQEYLPWVIPVKVKLRKLICKGTSPSGDTVFVGREMKIIEEIKK